MAECSNLLMSLPGSSCVGLPEAVVPIAPEDPDRAPAAVPLVADPHASSSLLADSSSCGGLLWSYKAGVCGDSSDTSAWNVIIDAQSLLVGNLACRNTSQASINDPFYRGNKTYEGYPLGVLWYGIPGMDRFRSIKFHCGDQYFAQVPLDSLPLAQSGFLALRDLSIPEGQEVDPFWMGFPFPRANGQPREGTPGHVYLLWADDHPYNDGNYWPYQVTSIELSADPLPVSADPAHQAGFQVFLENCFRCHSVPGAEGGKMGPNLTERKMTDGMSPEELRNFIANRPQVTDRIVPMPIFIDVLPDQALSDVAGFIYSLPPAPESPK